MNVLSRQGSISVGPLLGGLGLTTLVHGALVVLFSVFAGVSGATSAVERETPRPEIQFLETKLVRLGREFQPREMPNKLRATRSTGPAPRAEVPQAAHKRAPAPDQPPAPEDSVEDLLTRLGQSAAEQARIAERSEREGHTGGVEEGTETEGNERQLYQGQLYRFFRRGFQMPSAIPEAARAGLSATVMVRTSSAGVVEGFDLRSSGNSDFDQAVRLRMGQAVGAALPSPPNEALQQEFFGASFPIRFSPPR